MIHLSNKIKNPELESIIVAMNHADKHYSCYKCRNINLTNPSVGKGYFDLLFTATGLKTFTWGELVLHSSYRKTIIAYWEYIIKNYPSASVPLHEYAAKYLNSYKAFFRNYGLIEQVKGKPRGTMKLTKLGFKLTHALYRQMNE